MWPANNNKRSTQHWCLPVFITLVLVAALRPALGSDTAPTATATTIALPTVPVDELKLLLKPLTVDELRVEADAWLEILRAKVVEVSQAEIAVKQKHRIIEQAEEVQEAIEETQDLLEDVKDAARTARDEGSVDAADEAADLAEKARDAADETVEAIDEAIEAARETAAASNTVRPLADSGREADAAEISSSARRARQATETVSDSAKRTAAAAHEGAAGEAARLADRTAGAVGDAHAALADTSEVVSEVVDDIASGEQGSEQLEQTAEAVEAVAESQMEDKLEILDTVTALRAERTELIDRLTAVVDELGAKLGETAEGAEHEDVRAYRRYMTSVGGLQVDVSDTQAAWSTVLGWLRSDVGGLRLARNAGIFLGCVLGFWLLGLLLSLLLDRLMSRGRRTAMLIREFVVRSVRRSGVVVGAVVGLLAIDVNIGPLLAVIGAAGFVIAFALQNTLSNFASGMMIMLYRPFDMGDVIKVAGVTGVAQSMNLVTTTIATTDNQVLIVPNNSIWGNTIINITGSETRRVDLIVGISYEDDIAVAERIMREILAEHPLVLDQPEPVIAVHELAEYSVNFICRPWTRTENYWRVHWDVTRSVKERFEQAGLVTPYPHRNLHTHAAAPVQTGK